MIGPPVSLRLDDAAQHTLPKMGFQIVSQFKRERGGSLCFSVGPRPPDHGPVHRGSPSTGTPRINAPLTTWRSRNPATVGSRAFHDVGLSHLRLILALRDNWSRHRAEAADFQETNIPPEGAGRLPPVASVLRSAGIRRANRVYGWSWTDPTM
jgi:hypothetical protein